MRWFKFQNGDIVKLRGGQGLRLTIAGKIWFLPRVYLVVAPDQPELGCYWVLENILEAA